MNRQRLLLLGIHLGLLLPTLLLAQTYPRQFEDGDPLFTKTIKGTGVYLSDVATLEPNYAYSGSAERLDYKLFGLEWIWPSNIAIVAAEDIDSRIVGDQELYLVTDALGRRVFEINARTKVETWTFPPKQSATDPNDVRYLNKPVDAFIFRDQTTNYFKVVITDQDRNRVITVDKETSKIDWMYGDPLYREGNGFNQLRAPEDAEKIEDSSEYIIADKGNNRVIIVDSLTHTIVWQLGADTLKSPVDIQYLRNQGHILITDQANHRVIIVERSSKTIIWQFGRTGIPDSGSVGLKLPTDADILLPSRNVIISDAGNNRIIEVDASGKIVWQYHRRLNGLRDVDRIDNGRTLAVYENYPVRLAYTDTFAVSRVYDFGENRESVFDSLIWKGESNAGITSIALQLRSANSLGDLEGAVWYGPTGTTSYYDSPAMKINAVHNGHRLYQFRAFLRTTNPLRTPTLTNVTIKHHYYKVDQKDAFFYSPILSEASGTLVSKWKKLFFRTKLPSDPVKRDKINLEIRVMDGKSSQILERFTASKLGEENTINLETFSSLKGVQSIVLYANLTTLNSSVSPEMDYWELTWDAVPTANSTISFADKNGNGKTHYRATQTLPANESYVDSLYVFLKDADLEPFNTTYTVKVHSLITKDTVNVEMRLLTLGGFFSTKSIPILITQTADPSNLIMEAADRDLLVVSYQDPLNTLDHSSDSILVVKNTRGSMAFENPRHKEISKAWFGDSLYIRIKGEQDRNLDPNLRESVKVTVYDRRTQDEETITLTETATSNGTWNSGEFINLYYLKVNRSNNGVRGNGELETMPGHSITAEYLDNLPLVASVLVPSESDTGNGGGDVYIYFGRDPYVVEIGPNPFHRDRHDRFRMRVASSTGSLIVRFIEIFNIAGEKVRKIDGNTLVFSTGVPVPIDKYGVVENWWDMANESGQPVSSGTYWAKVHASLISAETGSVEQVAFYRKFVIIR